MNRFCSPYLAILVLLLVSGCQSSSNTSSSQTQAPSPLTAQQPSSPAPGLETASPTAATQLQMSTPAAITSLQSTDQQAQTAVTIQVQQALTALNAQRTGDGIRINLPDNILFDFDKANIRPVAKPTLAQLGLLIQHYGNAPVSIKGHTDSKGSPVYNQTLSDNRAASVKNYLVQNFGIAANRMTTQGMGESQPIAPNSNPDGSDNPAGRQQNRRVEVIIHTPSG